MQTHEGQSCSEEDWTPPKHKETPNRIKGVSVRKNKQGHCEIGLRDKCGVEWRPSLALVVKELSVISELNKTISEQKLEIARLKFRLEPRR